MHIYVIVFIEWIYKFKDKARFSEANAESRSMLLSVVGSRQVSLAFARCCWMLLNAQAVAECRWLTLIVVGCR